MDNLTAIFWAAARGFGDSLKGTVAIFYLDKNIKEKAIHTSPNRNISTPSRRDLHRETSKASVREEEPKVLKRTLQCCALNGGVFWFSLLVFEYGVLPLLKYLLTVLFGHSSSTGKSLWSWMKLFLSWTFGAFWVLPLFLLSKIVNSLWFQKVGSAFGLLYGMFAAAIALQRHLKKGIAFEEGEVLGHPLIIINGLTLLNLLDLSVHFMLFRTAVTMDIADSAYRYSRGRPQLLSGFSKLIADTLFSVLIQALFLVQSTLVSMLPIVFLGDVLCLVHMCMLYSLYSFEYKWFNMGWELHRRLTFIESNWPYFIGFGLPLAVLTALPSSFFNSGCVFSILFPLFIISGNEADPVTGACDYPLQLFSPVIAISNALFNRTIRPRATEPSKVRR